VHRAAIEKGAHQVKIERWQTAAAGGALVASTSQGVDFDLAGDPDPDLVDAEVLVDCELVNAAAGSDHLDDEIGTAVRLVGAHR
jgi:hypothetical protein